MVQRCSGLHMADNATGFFWDKVAMEPTISPQDKPLYDQFVTEYLKDQNQVRACQRMGYAFGFCKDYAERFMQSAYVAKEIHRRMFEADSVDSKRRAEQDIRIALEALRDTALNGYGASRVTAAKALLEKHGANDQKTKVDITMRGGVMLVPATVSIDDWEKEAIRAQESLMRQGDA